MKKPPLSARKTHTSRGAATRQRIVDAAVSITYAKGAESTSLDDGSSADPRNLAIGVLCAVQGGLLLAKTSRSEGALKVALDVAFDHVAGHRRPLSSSLPSGVSGSAKKRRP